MLLGFVVLGALAFGLSDNTSRDLKRRAQLGDVDAAVAIANRILFPESFPHK
jgi:hypothetical protein